MTFAGKIVVYFVGMFLASTNITSRDLSRAVTWLLSFLLFMHVVKLKLREYKLVLTDVYIPHNGLIICIVGVVVYLYVTLGGGAKYCDQRVCLSVCLSAHLCGKPSLHCTGYLWLWLSPSLMAMQYVMYCLFVCLFVRPSVCLSVTCRGSVLFWWQCSMLCTSCFVDYVMFLPRDAMLAWYMLLACVRPSVCPSVRLSQTDTVPNWLNIGTRK